ncbi:MAG: OmpH family outer membrane protein [Muribaculaceae bacterium]|nr:OmpH family outer membrane protein [Muribaculaceae bacterium]MDE6609572.1 OmpH family outer membrane protein [Muribaculaceae bacterium]
MIKKLLVALLVALPLCASAQKLGVVDTSAILPLMPEYKAAEQQLQEASQKYETEFAKLREEMEKKFADFQTLSEDPNTPQSIKDRRMQEVQELDQKVNQFYQTAQQDLQRQEQQLLQPVQQKMVEAIQSVGAENGFAMILPNGVAAYTSTDVVDVTPLVKTKLGI